MKPWLLTLLLLSVPGWDWLTHVRDHNAAQARGQAAWQRGQAAEAAYYFGQAAAQAGRGGPAPALLLSLGQAQAAAGQPLAARATLARLLGPAVPVAVGSAARQQLAGLLARQGQAAQAIGLLRQALRLNPANAAARYNYELLSQYLAEQTADEPDNPPPAAGNGAPTPPAPADGRQPDGGEGRGGQSPRPAGAGGTPKTEGQPNAPLPQAGGAGQALAPNPAGQPDRQPPPGAGGGAPGGTNGGTPGGFRPGAGPERPLPSGSAPGRQRGLDPTAAGGSGAAGGRGGWPGTEAATNADQQLQTQRERLKALNLSPAQARQLLDELRASEQQYLQQRPRTRQGAPLAPGTPTW